MIPFNKPYLTGKEASYIASAMASGKLCGDGPFTKKCQQLLERAYGFRKTFLTTSCTDALEMAALLLNIQPGDEVIVPSYTFVSTANAFALRGAAIVFADSGADNPNVDVSKLEDLITSRTKAIVVVHYAGVACDMDAILSLADKHGLWVVEDAAQAIDSYYKGRPLGTFGHLATFSFHETKNISCGEGGMLVVNDERFIERAEIIREKGTNRSQFFRGEIDKYGWVDIGSSFLPSELNAAFLYAQLESLEQIQARRRQLWMQYHQQLEGYVEEFGVQLPQLPMYASNNGHMFYLVCRNERQRSKLIASLKEHEIYPTFHYVPLHSSAYFSDKHDDRELHNCDTYAECLMRLPFFVELTKTQVTQICNLIKSTLAERVALVEAA